MLVELVRGFAVFGLFTVRGFCVWFCVSCCFALLVVVDLLVLLVFRFSLIVLVCGLLFWLLTCFGLVVYFLFVFIMWFGGCCLLLLIWLVCLWVLLLC